MVNNEHVKGSNCPQTVKTEIMVNRLATLICTDCLLTVQQLARIMDVLVDSVHSMLTEDLKMRRVCAVWVPHHLTYEQLQKWIDLCCTWK